MTRFEGGGPEARTVSAAWYATREPGYCAIADAERPARVEPPAAVSTRPPKKPSALLALCTLLVMALITYRRVGDREP